MALWGGLKILCPVSLQPSAGAGGTQSLPHFPRGLRGPFPPAGPLLLRRLDERFGLSTLIGRHLTDPRTGRSCQFPVGDLFRQSVYSRLAGYDDTNDAERLAEDSTFRMLVSGERRKTSVALTSTLHWFETEVLAEERNCQGLTRLNTAWCSTRRPVFSRGG